MKKLFNKSLILFLPLLLLAGCFGDDRTPDQITYDNKIEQLDNKFKFFNEYNIRDLISYIQKKKNKSEEDAFTMAENVMTFTTAINGDNLELIADMLILVMQHFSIPITEAKKTTDQLYVAYDKGNFKSDKVYFENLKAAVPIAASNNQSLSNMLATIVFLNQNL